MTEHRDEFEALSPTVAGETARAMRVGERMLDAEIEWRPRGVGAVLDLGFDLLRSHFASCFVLATVLWLPWRFLMILIVPQPGTVDPTRPSQIFSLLATAWAGNVLAWVAQSIVTAFVARLLYDAACGRDAGIGATLALVVRRLPGLLVLGVVNFVLLMAALMACFVPIIGMSWALAPLLNVYVIENVGIGQALRRSFQLSFENLFSWPAFYTFWRWVGIVTVSSLFIAPVSGLLVVFEVPEARSWIIDYFQWSEVTVGVVSILLGSLLLGVATAVQAGILTAYYMDLRVRRDGVDLSGWMQRLRGDAVRTAAPPRSVTP